MARPKSPTLTEGELRLMEIVWQKGAATAGEVVGAMPRTPPPAYSTVLTMLRILEDKGYLRHKKQGRAFVYEPVVDRGSARRSTVRHIVDRFFGGSAASLVLNVLENENLTEDEVRRLRERIGER